MIQIQATDPFDGIKEAVGVAGGKDDSMRLDVSFDFRREAYSRMVLAKPGQFDPAVIEKEQKDRLERTGCDMALGGIPARLVSGNRGVALAELRRLDEVIAVIICPVQGCYQDRSQQ
jgi:hypothetical protein